MLGDILLHSGEVLHVKKVLSEMMKQNKVVNLLGYCRAVATTVKPFAKRLKDHDL